jgi:tetratricopeptide (TPR) repeat protein
MAAVVVAAAASAHSCVSVSTLHRSSLPSGRQLETGELWSGETWKLRRRRLKAAYVLGATKTSVDWCPLIIVARTTTLSKRKIVILRAHKFLSYSNVLSSPRPFLEGPSILLQYNTITLPRDCEVAKRSFQVEDSENEVLLWRVNPDSLHLNKNGKMEETTVEKLDKPATVGTKGRNENTEKTRKDGEGLGTRLEVNMGNDRGREEELSRRVDMEVGTGRTASNKTKVQGLRDLESKLGLAVQQAERPYYKWQYRSKTSSSFAGKETIVSSVDDSGFSNLVTMKEELVAGRSNVSPDAQGLAVTAMRHDASKSVWRRDVDVAVMGSEGTKTTLAVSLVGEPGKPYQRLSINLDLQLYWARSQRQRGMYKEAAIRLKQCIRDWPDDGRPYVALGNLLTRMNKVQEARKVYEDGCQAVRGENAYIWQAWAVLEDRSGNSSKARKLFDAATVADKTHAAAWHAWAVLEFREGDTKKARGLLNKGLKNCGANEYIFQTLACIEVKAARFEQARLLFDKATRTNPKSAASWLAWALMESEQSNAATARQLFQKGLEASPKNRHVWQAWALFEAKQGNNERARQLFHRGYELNTRDPVLLQAFALFEYHCSHPGIARDLFKRASAVDPNHQPVWIAFGWMEWKEGNLAAARELFQRAVSVDSKTMDAVRAFQAWGILEEREENIGLARVLFKCALRVDSQNVPTWMSWAAMEERQGNAVRADELRNLCFQQVT